MNNLDMFVESKLRYQRPIIPLEDVLNANENYSRLEQNLETAPLTQSWEFHQHSSFYVMTFSTKWRDYALSLLKYRSVVGFYPPPFMRNENDMRRVEIEIAEAAKSGRQIIKAEDSPSYDPLKIAFRDEWNKAADKQAKDYNENEYVSAVDIYKEIKNTLNFDDNEEEP